MGCRSVFQWCLSVQTESRPIYGNKKNDPEAINMLKAKRIKTKKFNLLHLACYA
jgi:hypothetical protein